MTTTQPTSEKNLAAFIHLSTFSQVIIPLGNFIFPLLLWMAKRKNTFCDEHGKQALNFQLSIYLYSVFLFLAAVIGAVVIGIGMNPGEGYNLDNYQYWIDHSLILTPIVIYIIIFLFLFLCLLVLFIYGVVTATVRASEGKFYKYPLSINFLNARKRPILSEDNAPNHNAETL